MSDTPRMNTYTLRYYLKKVYKWVGYCYRCKSRLNYTRHGTGLCFNCGLRH